MRKKDNSVFVSYDKDADVLYVTVGNPSRSYVDLEIDGVLIRKDTETSEFCGLIILDFSKKRVDLSKLGVPNYKEIIESIDDISPLH